MLALLGLTLSDSNVVKGISSHTSPFMQKYFFFIYRWEGFFFIIAIVSLDMILCYASVSASEMTYIVSRGALNSTHSLTMPVFCFVFVIQLGLIIVVDETKSKSLFRQSLMLHVTETDNKH